MRFFRRSLVESSPESIIIMLKSEIDESGEGEGGPMRCEQASFSPSRTTRRRRGRRRRGGDGGGGTATTATVAAGSRSIRYYYIILFLVLRRSCVWTPMEALLPLVERKSGIRPVENGRQRHSGSIEFAEGLRPIPARATSRRGFSDADNSSDENSIGRRRRGWAPTGESSETRIRRQMASTASHGMLSGTARFAAGSNDDEGSEAAMHRPDSGESSRVSLTAAKRPSNPRTSGSTPQRRGPPTRTRPANHRGGNNAEGGGRRRQQQSSPPRRRRRMPMDDKLRDAIRLNKAVIECDDPGDVLSLFVGAGGARGTGGNGSVNSVNFSTMLHRIAKNYNNNNNRSSGSGGRKNDAATLGDPRFAVFLCALAEALAADVDLSSSSATADVGTEFFFSPRELSNIAWALAKLGDLCPPEGVGGDATGRMTPVLRWEGHRVPPGIVNGDGGKGAATHAAAAAPARSKGGDGSPSSVVRFVGDRKTFSSDLLASSSLLRRQILDIARRQRQAREERARGGDGAASSGAVGDRGGDRAKSKRSRRIEYLPTLRGLAGQVLDAVALRVLDYGRPGGAWDGGGDPHFHNQELANVMWAFATARRSGGTDGLLLPDLVVRLMNQNPAATSPDVMDEEGTRDNGEKNQGRHRPGGTRQRPRQGQGQRQFLKPQELSNSVWALATSGTRGREQVEFIKFVANAMTTDGFVAGHGQRGQGDTGDGATFAGRFKPQELSNTAWGATTLVSKRRQHDDAAAAADGKFDEVSPLPLVLTSDEVASSDDDNDETRAVFDILRAVTRALRDSPIDFKPQEISNTLWACATLKFGCNSSSSFSSSAVADRTLMYQTLTSAARSALPRLHRFRPQEINNLAWSFARLVETEPSDSVEAGVVEATMVSSDALFDGIGREILSRCRAFSPQDIGTTLWSFATMGYQSVADEMNERQGEHVARREEKTSSQLSGVDRDLDAVYRMAASRVNYCDGHRFKPQELSISVWALATAGVNPRQLNAFDTTLVSRPSPRTANAAKHGEVVSRDLLLPRPTEDDPITECFGAVAEELIRRPQEFKEQELKDVLWSFSKIGMRHPPLFRLTAEHLVGEVEPSSGEESPRLNMKCRGLRNFQPQGLGNLAWSYAKQAQMSNGIASSPENDFAMESNGRLAVYETSCLDIGEALIGHLFAEIGEASLRNDERLDWFKPQDISNTAWAFAALGLLHSRFFSAVADETKKRISMSVKDGEFSAVSSTQFKGQEVSNLIWAFATLNVPAPGLLDAVAPYVVSACSYPGEDKGSSSRRRGFSYDERSIAKRFNRPELANLAWSCAVLEQYPPLLIPLLYTGLLGRGDGPEHMRRITGDKGLQKHAIMSLLYVQLAMDAEAPHLELSLPHGFPDGWGERSTKDPHQSSIAFVEGADEPILKFSTSRMQSSVSRALHRIGFEHIEEHTLGFDPESGYIKESTSSPLRFLSIDVANVDMKVGVEVDGPAHFIKIVDPTMSKNPPLPFSQIDLTARAKGMGGDKGQRWHQRRHINGPTVLKHRLLCHLGWVIAHIPFWDWNAVAGKAEDEDNYCKQLLKEVTDE